MNSLIKIGLYIFFNFFLWFAKVWYKITIYFTQTKNFPVKVYSTPEEIASALEYGTMWRSDPLGGAFDVVYHPTRVQRNIAENEEIGDCDDHAIYWCAALLKSGLAKRTWISFYHMEKRSGRISGHALCVFQGLDDKYYWTDYHHPRIMWHKHQWYEQSSYQRGAKPLHAAMLEVKYLKFDDTPVFGKVIKLR